MKKEFHFKNYLARLNETVRGVSSSVKTTVENIVPFLSRFSSGDHLVGLLLGHVQSGKTGNIFGVASAAADQGFDLCILLTTDNVYLQEQTYKRALQYLDTFNICNETDDLRFLQGGMRKPALIILKKNVNVLKTWKSNLASSGFCKGRPIFIIDDEGDAASLNTNVNQRSKAQSSINKHLQDIKELTPGSVYLQVTATPQSIILQTQKSGWRPNFCHYFPPGKGYLGGSFVYSDPESYTIKMTAENELEALLNEGEIPEGMKLSLFSFLVAGSHILCQKSGNVCNFLIHPSIRTTHHQETAAIIHNYLKQLLNDFEGSSPQKYLKQAWEDLQKTQPDLIPLLEIKRFLKGQIKQIQIIIMNSLAEVKTAPEEGMNIVIGGNSLGRGITFPALQTVYYCRSSRTPQADTFWQHCRMFGYDRMPGLMRVYMAPSLWKLFTELNSANQSLISQIQEDSKLEKIHLLYPPKIKPSRKNVLDADALSIIVGDVNYFPNEPKRLHVQAIDEMLASYADGIHHVDLALLEKLLALVQSEKKSDWNNLSYINCIKALRSKHLSEKGWLIVKRDRDIKKGTGTLLSPDDRKKGDQFKSEPVLTMYRLIGSSEKGWDGHPLWVPNIKLPKNLNFYRTD